MLEMQNFNIQNHNDRVKKEREDQHIDTIIGLEQASRVQKAGHDETHVEHVLK